MQTNLLTMVRGLFSPALVKSGDAKYGIPTAVLCLPSWMGHRTRHLVQVLGRETAALTVWSPEHIDVGETVWLEEGGKSVCCNVQEYVATNGGYRLKLGITGTSRRYKERAICNTPGDIEWVDGLTRVKCPVRVTNLTNDGAQVTLSRPTPEIRSVRLQFNGRAKVGTIRYCVQIGTSYLAGIEFV